jgi:ketosteroid isomerase-like protein
VLTKRLLMLAAAPILTSLAAAAVAEAPAQAPPAPEAPTAPQPQAMPTVSLPAPLQRVLTDYETAWRNRDAAALAALFAEDGFVLSSGAPPVRGRAAIAKHYTGAGGPLALRAIAFGVDGSLAWIVGGFARQSGEPDTGKFTLTLRQGPDGRWLINSDMDNGNARR